ncbi:MAG: DUF2934 domain-containing protein [Planctomycetota bacterium]
MAEKKDKKAKKTGSAKKVTKSKKKTIKKKPVKKASTKTTTKRKGKGPAKKNAKPVVVITHDQIAQKAYEIWMAKGCPDGQDEANWNEAKSELESVSN